ncbi:MAG: hypothetical protein WA940_10050 [Sphingopyxis sp.]
MTRKPLLALLTTLLLLPASCASGYAANRMQGVRLGTEAGAGGPLWAENLLWLGALVLVIVWARQMKRIFPAPAAPQETGE